MYFFGIFTISMAIFIIKEILSKGFYGDLIYLILFVGVFGFISLYFNHSYICDETSISEYDVKENMLQRIPYKDIKIMLFSQDKRGPKIVIGTNDIRERIVVTGLSREKLKEIVQFIVNQNKDIQMDEQIEAFANGKNYVEGALKRSFLSIPMIIFIGLFLFVTLMQYVMGKS